MSRSSPQTIRRLSQPLIKSSSILKVGDRVVIVDDNGKRQGETGTVERRTSSGEWRVSFEDGTYSDFGEDQMSKKKKPPPPKLRPRPKKKPPQVRSKVERKRDEESKEDEVVVTVRKPEKARSRRSHNFKFLLWWYYQCHCCAHILFWLGMNAVLWADSDLDEASDYGNKPLGAIICVISALWALVLVWFGLSLEKDSVEDRHGVPYRAILQGIFAVVCLCNAVTSWGGYCLLWTAATGAFGFYQGERGILNPPKPKRSDSGQRRKSKTRRMSRRMGSIIREEESSSDEENEHMNDTTGFREGVADTLYDCTRFFRRTRRQGRVALIVWTCLYVVANIIVFVHASSVWFKKASDAELTAWVGLAKVAGKLLDFNLALLLIPVTRSLMLWMNDFGEHSSFNFAKWIPLRHNIEFHKVCALVVLGCASVHVIAHYIDFVFVPRKILDLYSYGPWITGPMICVSMFHIYSSAPEIVRRSKYLIFWYNHHAFIFFYLLLFVHMVQKETYFEQFFPYAIVPVLMYTGERIMRIMRGTRPVMIKRVKYIPPVLELHLEPVGSWFKFKEGQYLYLNIPHIDPNLGELFSSWHPFTISSAMGDLKEKTEKDRFVSLHIKVWPGGWTEKLKNYLELMNPNDSYPMTFTRRDEYGAQKLGKILGPDNKPLIRIDGPHASPSQHYDEYKTLMLVGVGVGMTPCASILRGILLYKMKRGVGPNNVYFYWAVRHKEVMAYQWFVSMLTELLHVTALNRSSGKIDNTRFVEVHIFVTSVDSKAPIEPMRSGEQVVFETKTSSKGVRDKNAAGFSAEQLWKMLQRPNVDSSRYNAQLELAAKNPKAPKNRLSNLWIWSGRPNWDAIFLDVAKRRPMDSEYVGICFCGMSAIGDALQECCEKHSRPSESLIFNLHKENF